MMSELSSNLKNVDSVEPTSQTSENGHIYSLTKQTDYKICTSVDKALKLVWFMISIFHYKTYFPLRSQN